MRWFKHFTDNHRGRSMDRLINEMGHAGLSLYVLMELCAEKLEKFSDRKIEKKDCVFGFSPRVLDNALRMKRKSTRQLLRISQECGRLNFTESDVEIRIEMPMLVELLEYDQMKSRRSSDEKPPAARLEQNRVEQNRIEKINIVHEPKKAARGTSKETLSFGSIDEIKKAIPEVCSQTWFKLYDSAYVDRELLKVSNWLVTNPNKNKKTLRGWLQFLSNWLERGWSQYQASLPTTKAEYKGADLSDVFGEGA